LTYEEFAKAKDVFGITIPASYKKISKRYKDLMKALHPDVSELIPDEAESRSAKVNSAYEILKNYCENYRMDFSEKEFYRQVDEANLDKRFFQDHRQKK